MQASPEKRNEKNGNQNTPTGRRLGATATEFTSLKRIMANQQKHYNVMKENNNSNASDQPSTTNSTTKSPSNTVPV